MDRDGLAIVPEAGAALLPSCSGDFASCALFRANKRIRCTASTFVPTLTAGLAARTVTLKLAPRLQTRQPRHPATPRRNRRRPTTTRRRRRDGVTTQEKPQLDNGWYDEKCCCTRRFAATGLGGVAAFVGVERCCRGCGPCNRARGPARGNAPNALVGNPRSGAISVTHP